MSASREEIVRSYRLLYKKALVAIRYSSPARHTLRRVIHNAYSTNPAEAYNPWQINNTVKFLEYAAEEKGIEHKIVKGLLHVWYFNGALTKRQESQKSFASAERHFRAHVFQHYELTIEMMNRTMMMCIPTSARARDADFLRSKDERDAE